MNPKDVRCGMPAMKIQMSHSTWMSHLMESQSERQGVDQGHWTASLTSPGCLLIHAPPSPTLPHEGGSPSPHHQLPGQR